MKAFVTTKEVADILGVSVRTVHGWLRNGDVRPTVTSRGGRSHQHLFNVQTTRIEASKIKRPIFFTLGEIRSKK